MLAIQPSPIPRQRKIDAWKRSSRKFCRRQPGCFNFLYVFQQKFFVPEISSVDFVLFGIDVVCKHDVPANFMERHTYKTDSREKFESIVH